MQSLVAVTLLYNMKVLMTLHPKQRKLYCLSSTLKGEDFILYVRGGSKIH